MEAAAKGSRDAEEHFASTRSHTESHCRADLLDFIRSENAHQRFKAVQRQGLHLKAVCRRVFRQSVALRRLEIHQPRDSQVLRIPAGDGNHDAQGQLAHCRYVYHDGRSRLPLLRTDAGIKVDPPHLARDLAVD